MKNKYGFTLVELLGAIVILALLSLIAIPVVTNVVKSNKQKLYEIQLKNIESAAKAWGSDNLGELPDPGDSIKISLEDLQENGYIEKNLKNPKTGEILKDIEITVCNIRDQYIYTTDPEENCKIPDSCNTQLETLTVNDVDILDSKTITIDSVSEVTIEATTKIESATVTGIGTKSVNVGTNTFDIIVNTTDGCKKTYTVTVVVTKKSSDANLSELALSNCTINFNSNTINYSCTVNNNITSTIVSATTSDSKATIDGVGEYNLSVGSNEIVVKVTAEDGTTKTYTVNITRQRALSGDATLKSLSASGDCILTPTFNSNTTNYSCTVGRDTTSIEISASANSSKASVSIPEFDNLEDEGTYEENITVTAENGTTKTYKISIYKDAYTSKSCFEFDSETQTITDYYCYAENDKNLPTITDIIIPPAIGGKAVLEIGDSAFYNKDLTSAIMVDNIQKISAYAFKSNSISDLTIPSTVTIIEKAAFNNNQLPDDEAFIYDRNENGTEDNTKIVSYGGANSEVEVPSNVSIIGIRAFEDCGIGSITLPSSLQIIEDSAFSGNSLDSILIPSNVYSIGDSLFGTEYPTYIYNNTGRKFYWSKIIDGTENSESYSFGDIIYSSDLTDKEISIITTGSIEYLYGDGFKYKYYSNSNDIECSILGPDVLSNGHYESPYYTTLNIPENLDVPTNSTCTVKRIGFNYYNQTSVAAFQGIHIDSLNLPSTTSYIGNDSFSSCGISNVDLSDINYIGSSAFKNNNLTSITFDVYSLYIGNSAFENNNLSNIDFNFSISNPLSGIGLNAFSNQDNVSSIYLSVNDPQYKNNMGNWNQIIGADTSNSFVCTWGDLGSQTIHQYEYCYINNISDSNYSVYVSNPDYES